MKVWLTLAETEWKTASFGIVAESLAKALRRQGAEVLVSYGEGDPNRPADPEEWNQVGFGIWDQFYRWGPVRRYLAYSLLSAVQFPWDKAELMTRQLNHADAVLVPDDASRRWTEIEGVTAPIHVLRHGADPEACPFIERQRGPEDPYTFCVAGVGKRQGGWLIPAAFQAAFKGRFDVRLRIHDYHNSDTPQLPGVDNDPRVIVTTGWVDSLLPLYEQSDCVLSPSLWESGDISLAEAMMTGLPAIVSNIENYREWLPSNMAEWVRFSTGGVAYREFFGGAGADIGGVALVPCIHSLAEKMKYAFERREALAAKGKEAAAYLRKAYTWGHSARLLRNVIGATESRPFPAQEPFDKFFDPYAPVQPDHLANEFPALLDAYREKQPAVTVEIGSFYGGSLWQWMKNAPEGATVISVDQPGLVDGWNVPYTITERWETWGKLHGVEFKAVQGLSQDPETLADLKDALAGKGIDFLFIDGGHSYEECKADFEAYRPLMSAGGVIALHDIYMSRTGVPRFWAELQAAGYETREFGMVDGDKGVGTGLVFLRTEE